MRRTLLFVLGGILLGGIIHIVVVFLVPLLRQPATPGREMKRFGRDGQFHVLPMPRGRDRSRSPRSIRGWSTRSAASRSPTGRSASARRCPTTSGRWRSSTAAAATSTASTTARPSASQLDLAVLTPVQMAQLRRGSAGLARDRDRRRGADRGRLRACCGCSSPTIRCLPAAIAALQTADCAGRSEKRLRMSCAAAACRRRRRTRREPAELAQPARRDRVVVALDAHAREDDDLAVRARRRPDEVFSSRSVGSSESCPCEPREIESADRLPRPRATLASPHGAI